MMELYTVYVGWKHSKPTLYTLQVVKETAKTYVLNGSDTAAGYAKVVPKDSCPFALTPDAAWDVYKAKLLKEIGATQNKLDNLQHLLAEAQKVKP